MGRFAIDKMFVERVAEAFAPNNVSANVRVRFSVSLLGLFFSFLGNNGTKQLFLRQHRRVGRLSKTRIAQSCSNRRYGSKKIVGEEREIGQGK